MALLHGSGGLLLSFWNLNHPSEFHHRNPTLPSLQQGSDKIFAKNCLGISD